MLLSLVILALVGLAIFILYNPKDQTINIYQNDSVKIKFSLIESLIRHDLFPLIPNGSKCKVKIKKVSEKLNIFLLLSKVTPLQQKEIEHIIQHTLSQNLTKLTGYPGSISIAIRFRD